MEIKHNKNEELAEKLALTQKAYEDKAQTKLGLLEKEHSLKMERLEKSLEIAKITGIKVEEEE